MLCQTRIPGARVEMILERAIEFRGAKPEALIVDNGPEFICNLLEDWGERQGVRLHFIEKGKPFHSILRREFLHKHWFRTIAEIVAGVLEYQHYYNLDREDSSLGWWTPEEFEQGLSAASSPPAPQLSTSIIIARYDQLALS